MRTALKAMAVIAPLGLFFLPAAWGEEVAATPVEEIVLVAVGDIMPTEGALPFIHRHGYGYPYEATREILKGGDIAIGNMEAPLTRGGERVEEKKFTFRAPIESAAALKAAGFTHLSLANNHMMDYGEEGLLSTLKALDEAGLQYAGGGKDLAAARRASIVEVKGRRIAFLSYSKTYPVEFYATAKRGGTAPGYEGFVEGDVKRAAAAADIVIVAFHWGAEKMETPKPYQQALARLAIDSGADVVLGHHPHVLQGIEYYGAGVIFYSLGNFAFGSYSPSSTESIIARITLTKEGIGSVEAIPLNVNNREVLFRPKPLDGEKGAALIERLSTLSVPLGSRLVYAEGVGTAAPAGQVTLHLPESRD